MHSQSHTALCSNNTGPAETAIETWQTNGLTVELYEPEGSTIGICQATNRKDKNTQKYIGAKGIGKKNVARSQANPLVPPDN